MRRWRSLTTLLVSAAALAACSGKPETTKDMDVANAASAAQNDIDNYAADGAGGTDATARADNDVAGADEPVTEIDDDTGASPLPASPGTTPGVPSGSPTSLPEAPFPPDSAQGAANVVQTYYALLEAGRYRQAWRLWADGGRASGMSADAFAASFAKYREYHAQVGAPGRIDAGAGQRYVTVPVRVYGTLKAGNAAFAMAGPITLHHVVDIDGATEAQRSWRISTSGVRPRPAETVPTPTPSPTKTSAISAMRYRCADGADVLARFDNDANTAKLRIGTTRVVLRGQRPASGLWYRGQGYELRGNVRSADLSRPGKTTTTCTAR